jgi:hypothetical protein
LDFRPFKVRAVIPDGAAYESIEQENLTCTGIGNMRRRFAVHGTVPLGHLDDLGTRSPERALKVETEGQDRTDPKVEGSGTALVART